MAKITNSLGIIPARFSSTRFPGKPLVDIAGKTMIQRVYEQASKSSLGKVVVATDDPRIFDNVLSFGGEVVMTSDRHLSGTDRCAEVAALPQFIDFQFVVNVQGDEPFIQPGQIDLALAPLVKNAGLPIATLAKQIDPKSNLDLTNPNLVKVVFDKQQRALYFSRWPMPFHRNLPKEKWLAMGLFYKHVGLYAFRRKVLLEVAMLPPSRLELAESLEQLRWLENGYPIGVALTEFEIISIDSPSDLELAVRHLAGGSR
ncbi:MAG: 3-deoxy-manno-octulosonate cytidylyltransferase [Saprospiraceae bacterium]|nr:3-deoxy-manno-octulosonate cytidylyltransferase [Saprospiraceae bacterium]MCF8250428.1 3-deoxy-manno-octulosonate cytidylyltransferase [Saprospiraceae bacterium]MCF8280652.1 3-deoxy-manno-octulosonate cytidylyltransferase [Bacteroidales bacterium]MCF8312197.1 3-deoxy-manno-octulosonate cytidylyltransferase [Saprospiraceae bacterium]MCF8440538.1 3-deoxy-manno-octulosonate cytidylyltransferase [Saprospiraceae bacterium]